MDCSTAKFIFTFTFHKCKFTETFFNNKTDVIIRNNVKDHVWLKDVAISKDRNVNRKEAEKILKRIYLVIE